MEQLIMYWADDGTPAVRPTVPEGLRLATLPELSDGIDQWLDVVQYGLSEGKQDEAFYQSVMIGHAGYNPFYCYLVMDGKQAVATITVIFYPETADGYIHMVACKESHRGRGIGTYMNQLAVYLLKAHGMKTASLTTDDWRIPAIKSYLRAGFRPDLSTEDFRQRWEAINRTIHG